MEEPGLQSLRAREKDAIDCVPDSMYMFLQLSFGDQKLLHWETVEEEEAEARCKVLSCAQDIACGWVAERNGHLSTLDWEAPFIKLHRQKICHAFHKVGHILSYDQILQVDTTLTKSALKTLDSENGSVMPPHLLPWKFRQNSIRRCLRMNKMILANSSASIAWIWYS